MRKESLLSSMPKLILAVVLIVCIGAVMGLMGWALTKKQTVNDYQDVKVSKEDIERETVDWQVYEYKDWGLSMKIPQDYAKKEKNVEAGSLRLYSTIFSKDNEDVSIIIDKSEDIDSLRAAVIDAFNKFESGKEKEVLKILNEFKIDDSEIIDFDKMEIENCIGMRFIAKNNNKYIHDIILVSLDKKDINIQISFKYHNEKTKLEVAKMIGTIECAGVNETDDWQTYRDEEFGFEMVNHPECSGNNPPSIYDGGRKTYMPSLNLCGEKTEFPAYEFEEENLILFTDKRNDDHEPKTYSLKIISTQYPFEEKVLSTKINDLNLDISNLFEERGLYFWGAFGDGPGYYASVFIFEPKSKDFVYFYKKAMLGVNINIVSSKSLVAFNAEKKTRVLLEECEDCALSNDDIEIIINDEEFVKKDVDNELIKNQEALFSCQPLGFIVPEDNYYEYPDRYPDSYGRIIERGKINIRKYIKYFPDKFPCFINEESDKITGYFDLVENKFVSAEDSK